MSSSVSATVAVEHKALTASLRILTGSGDSGDDSGQSDGERVRFASIQSDDTILDLDASASFDPNTGSASALDYEWKCEQIKPSYEARCPGLSLGVLSKWQNARGSDRVSVSFKAPHTSNKVTMTVRSVTDGRAASDVVIVDTKWNHEPVIKSLYWLEGSQGAVKPNMYADVSIVGSIAHTDDVKIEWSVYPLIPDLNVLVKTPLVLSKTAPSNTSTSIGTLSVYLKVPGVALIPESQYVFTLATTSANSSLGSVASIALQSNAPPQPGSFVVTPKTGTEFATLFDMHAINWEDNDLPLMYAFKVVDSSSGRLTLLQGFSEALSGTSMLASGETILECEVVDVLDASKIVNDSVTVVPNPDTHDITPESEGIPKALAAVDTFVKQRLTNTTFSAIVASPVLAKQVHTTISPAMSMLNRINCSLATESSCRSLNRNACRNVAHTCSACKTGFVGEPKDANSLCVLIPKNTSAASTTLGGSSTQDVSGHHDSIHTYLRDVLDLVPRACPGQCGGHGYCHHRLLTHGNPHQTITNNKTFVCSVSSTICDVTCRCDDGWSGAGCEYTDEELRLRKSIKDNMLDR